MTRVSFFAGIYLATLVFQGCSDETPKPTGLPGDNLDLYAVLDLFKSSKTIEGFEKSLNDKSSTVNNLDLNGDEKVDYICVIDQQDADAHAIVLRVHVTLEESQDVAVIEIEKTGEKTASLQIIGDEEIYGKDRIVEPKEDNDQAGFVYATSVGVNVWLWPSVSYVYMPEYVVWVSPYRYAYYPVYWTPWPPIAYEVYQPMVFKNHGHYVSYNKHRFKHAHEMYYSNRIYSPFVVERKRNGDFHEGKQKPHKGNDFSKGNSGKENHGMGNDKQGGGGNEKQGAGNEKHQGGGNEKQGGNNKQIQKEQNSPKGQESHGGGSKNSVGNDKKGKSDGGKAPKSGGPKGGSKPKGGGKPK